MSHNKAVIEYFDKASGIALVLAAVVVWASNNVDAVEDVIG